MEHHIPLKPGTSFGHAQAYALMLDETSDAIVNAAVVPDYPGAPQYYVKVTIQQQSSPLP